MTSTAATVEEYLAGLPEDRREAISAIRKVILENLPNGYVETMQYGMIGYVVPHSIWPGGYHCDPKQALPYVHLGSQKNHMALYLMCVYGDESLRKWFEEQWAQTGKKLDMGKACVRFKKLENLPLDVIGKTIARVPVDKYLERYQAILGGMKSNKKSAKTG